MTGTGRVVPAKGGSAGRFAVVGVGAVVIDYLTYVLLLAVDVPTTAAKAVAFLTGAGFAFALNGRFTFGSRLTGPALARFAAVYAVGLLLNTGVNAAVLAVLSGDSGRRVAFLLATGASAFWNYVGMRSWVFAAEPSEHDET